MDTLPKTIQFYIKAFYVLFFNKFITQGTNYNDV